MKIGIIGHGYVGSAIAWAHRNHTVIVNDPAMEKSQPISSMSDCSAVYVCVPSPQALDGSCDSSILLEVVEQLGPIVDPRTPIICKTTAPPDVYLHLQSQWRNVVFAPEFLRARSNLIDYQTTSTWIIGGHRDIAHRASGVIVASCVDNNNFILIDMTTACLYKYLENSLLATKVTFMNDYKALCDSWGANWSGIQDLIATDPRLGTRSHTDVPGYDGLPGWGGHCFPKDINAILSVAKERGVDLALLEAVKSRNEQHRGSK